LANAGLRGAAIRFDDAEVVAPAPLGCASARYEFVVSPAEGMFQGSLPAPAEAAARALGAVRLPVITLAVSCDAGLFDYQLVAPDTALLALDGVVWTLKRTAAASSAGPEAVVQELLGHHMTHDMGFTPETVASKRAFLTASLGAAIDGYFARPKPSDEPPPIDGDPFTDSQEYPPRFTLHAAAVEGAAAVVPITFSDGLRARRVGFVVGREGEGWRIDDLRYERGTTFRDLLALE
jgi:hypothetical protein